MLYMRLTAQKKKKKKDVVSTFKYSLRSFLVVMVSLDTETKGGKGVYLWGLCKKKYEKVLKVGFMQEKVGESILYGLGSLKK